MNILFTIMLLAPTIYLAITNPSAVLVAITTSSSSAITLCVKMLGIYAIWLAILELIQACNLSAGLAKLLSPIIKFLFGDLSDNAKYFIAMNMSCNILGVGNAGTPLAINAIKEIKSNTYALAMFMVINATSLQLLPSTVMSLLSSYGSSDPSGIFLPALIGTAVSTTIGILLVMVVYRRGRD